MEPIPRSLSDHFPVITEYIIRDFIYTTMKLDLIPPITDMEWNYICSYSGPHDL